VCFLKKKVNKHFHYFFIAEIMSLDSMSAYDTSSSFDSQVTLIISLKFAYPRNRTEEEMNRRHYVIVSAILIVLVIAGLVALISNRAGPVDTPVPLYTSGFSSWSINAPQGTTQQVNLTLSSFFDSPLIAVPIENLRIVTGPPTNQEATFNYSLSLSQLTLQPHMSNITVISIKLANNVPLGKYTISVGLGEVKFLSANGNNSPGGKASAPEALQFEMIVTPKETS
jgi:hypothetical protein